ncbi:MAG: flagellar hook-associated protein FlgK [Spirochaetes bacterium]|nr:flagellar hook-associated protein FlgK [Spirochaetota bacterium]
MASTFMGIELGKKGVIAHQTALQTTGHNVTNAETEGYSRQKVVLNTQHPLYDPSLSRPERAGHIGQGVKTARIERIRNAFIDDRILDLNDSLGFWKTKNEFLYQVELVHNEPSDVSLRNLLDQFWGSWEELANNPQELAVRKVVRERSETLMQGVNRTFDQLKDIQNNVDFTIRTRVQELNNISKKIRDLNVEIAKAENLGDVPNDLYDTRDSLVEELSKMFKINVVRNEKDEFIIFWKGEHLVQGGHFEEVKMLPNPKKNGYVDLYWGETNNKIDVKGGELEGLFDMRDNILVKQIDQLNNFTANLADLVNEVHRDGFALDSRTDRNFFHYIPATDQANGDYDSNNDGQLESTALFKIAGNKTLKLQDKIGISGTLSFASNRTGGPNITVNYVPTDTVQDVINKINRSDAEVVAYLDHRNRLAVKAPLTQNDDYKHFLIRHLEDSGDFLVNYSGILNASGPAGAYDWQRTGAATALQVGDKNYTVTPLYDISSWVALDANIKNDVMKIAAASGTDTTGAGDADVMTGVGDGSIALDIAGLRYKKAMIGEQSTFDDYYTALISETGALSEQAKLEHDTTEQLNLNLVNLRKSVSGVNLDEEIANMVMFQHGYNASARVVSTMDHMLDTIINRMGV